MGDQNDRPKTTMMDLNLPPFSPSNKGFSPALLSHKTIGYDSN